MNAADRWAALRFIAVFVAVFAALQAGMLKSKGTAIESLIVDRATVGVAAVLVDRLFREDGVRASGNAIVSSRARLNVLPGCDGIDAMFLVIAGALAFPAPWRARLAALVGGVALAYTLNQLRILALYVTIRDARQYFELVHAYIAPAVLIAAIVLFFWSWTMRGAPGRMTASLPE